jgi:hypothetical protein
MIFFILIFLTGKSTLGQSVEEARLLLNKAKTKKDSCLYYAAYLNQSTNPVVKGYGAMMLFLEADNVFNPFSKLHFFNSGKAILDSCIQQHPGLLELRLLRYAVQNEIPSILGYDNRNEDKKILLQSIHLIEKKDEYLYKRIKETVYEN